jgi:hypothetical protein
MDNKGINVKRAADRTDKLRCCKRNAGEGKEAVTGTKRKQKGRKTVKDGDTK